MHSYTRLSRVKSNKRQKQRRPEQELQHTAGKFLDLALPEDAIWLHYPAGGKRSPIEARIFKSLGVRSGVPDLLIFHSGHVYGVELKAPGRRGLTEVQRDMHRRLEQCGVPCCVATTVDEVADFLEPRIPLRAHLEARDRSGSSDRNAGRAAIAASRNQ